jgi:hypothetical protein
MDNRVRTLLTRLARESAFADRYFADPDPILAEMDIPDVERPAMRTLDRAAVQYLDVAGQIEPTVAVEHPSNNVGNRHLTLLIALWGCATYVIVWLMMSWFAAGTA